MSISGLDILVGLYAVLGSAVAIWLGVRRPTAKIPVPEAGTEKGRSINWVLDQERRTQIISNERLAVLQRHQSHGGVLRDTDLVIVWAREFLDHDILFEPVRQNILDSVQYLYILDHNFVDKFVEFLDALANDTEIPPEVIKKNIDVVFVKPELVFNNFVLMAAGSDHQQMYSSLIFDQRPFAWLKQAPYRAQTFFNSVERLVKCVSVDRCFKRGSDGIPHEAVASANGLYSLESQIMGADNWGRGFLGSGEKELDNVPINLKNEVLVTELPTNESVIGKIDPKSLRG